jgi:hypothetical protein
MFLLFIDEKNYPKWKIISAYFSLSDLLFFVCANDGLISVLVPAEGPELEMYLRLFQMRPKATNNVFVF